MNGNKRVVTSSDVCKTLQGCCRAIKAIAFGSVLYHTAADPAGLKEHVALDRTSWSMKSVCNSVLINFIWLESCLKLEYNDLEIAWFSCYCAN